MLKKHLKPSQKNPSGGIIEINKKIAISNVMIICPNCSKITRIGYKGDSAKKTRICRKCLKSI